MVIGGTILQIVIAGGLLNVWLLRNSQSSSYRGGAAQNLMQEFEVYGLSKTMFYLVGFLKVTAALLLIAGIWWTDLRLLASTTVAVLMLGALAMHLKVGDPFKKSLPALAMLGMSGTLTYLSLF